jgi:CelD/BcsL family acetyltransferase involved in cellulose biosynthesis
MTTHTTKMLAGAAALDSLAEQWDALAPSPFLTVAWLDAWWDAFGTGVRVTAVVRDAAGALVGGAALLRRRGRLEAAANVHSGDWDVVAAGEQAHAQVWRAIAATGAGTLRVEGMVREARGTDDARRALRDAGYRLTERPRAPSPRMALPGDVDALLASVSRNLRSQLGRRRRALERQAELRLRVVTDGAEVASALDAVLRLEASGWKGQAGSAILSDPATERLYRSFATAAARGGFLRIYLLELDGAVIAGDIGCSHRGVGYLLKTTFDERLSRSSPGMVLRGEVLRACIEEGLREYDFLGGAETYKMQWGPVARPRVEIRAFKGPRNLPEWAWWSGVRPTLRVGLLRADAARKQLARRRGGANAPESGRRTPQPAPDREG